MYYLRKEPYEQTIPEIRKTDGTVIPERKYKTDDRVIFKHIRFARFYRRGFNDANHDMKLYTCKTLKRIKKLQKSTFEYCGEMFDIYDENGKVDVDVNED